MKQQIKEALKKERYNFGHLADQMGYDSTYLSRVLNKKCKAPKRFFFTLCACLNEMTGSTFTTEDFKEYTK
jgi:hypothetical protein